MAFLTLSDELSSRPARILVAGSSGAGKTTLARRIAAAVDVPHVELDVLYDGANWIPRPEFLDDVRCLAAREQWVTEWGYQAARQILADRADLRVVLDLPRWLVTLRIFRRTLSRRVRRTGLWNGNVEPPLHAFFQDRDHVIRHAWRTYADNLPRVRELIRYGSTLAVVRLRTPAEIETWLKGPLARAKLRQEDAAERRRDSVSRGRSAAGRVTRA